MADDDGSKSAIPAWQRAQQKPLDQKQEDAKIETPSKSSEPEAEKPTDVEIPTPADPTYGTATEDSTSEPSDPAAALEQMKTFLEDPAVKNAPTEKKRAFLESKGMGRDLIDQVLREEATVEFSDFESFKEQQQQVQPKATAPPPSQQQSSSPPIITYPEFLIEAHKPPPLITPGRIIDTAYVASGIAALIYGASKYLVTPMAASLTEARHDFSLHSQSKIDEMNERLTKLVSRLPEPRKEDKTSEADEDTESETSDPTELYHRDFGTQTSPSPTPSLSRTASDQKEAKKKNTNDYHYDGLFIIKEHLSEMLQRSQNLETTYKQRQDSVNDLKSYLDTLMYASSGIYNWAEKDEKKNGGKEDEDVVEELKKEIRGVKGVLLSAKRFPGVAGKAEA